MATRIRFRGPADIPRTRCARLGYYNSGEATVAVPCEVLDPIAVPPKPGMVDGNAGPVVLNRAATWALIEANVIAPPRHPIEAEHRGARRRTEAPRG